MRPYGGSCGEYLEPRYVCFHVGERETPLGLYAGRSSGHLLYPGVSADFGRPVGELYLLGLDLALCPRLHSSACNCDLSRLWVSAGWQRNRCRYWHRRRVLPDHCSDGDANRALRFGRVRGGGRLCPRRTFGTGQPGTACSLSEPAGNRNRIGDWCHRRGHPMVFAQPRFGSDKHAVQCAGSGDGDHCKCGTPVGPTAGQSHHEPLAIFHFFITV